MGDNVMLGTVYILMAMMLVLSALMVRRERPARLLTMLLAWIAIFGAGFVLFTFRDDFGWVMQRLRAEATGEPVTQGETVRVPMALDGHFWVDATINGKPVRFLVDSGATMTTIGQRTARQAGIEVDTSRGQIVRTGNGLVKMGSGRADSLTIGPIEREKVRLHVASSDELNVLGMNYLTSLKSWGVEGRWLLLTP